MFWIFVRIASVRRFSPRFKTYILFKNKNERPFLHINLPINESLQQQIHFNGSIFGTDAVLVTRVHYIRINELLLTDLHTVKCKYPKLNKKKKQKQKQKQTNFCLTFKLCNTVKPQWLDQLWNHGHSFEIWVVRAIKG